MRAYLADCGRPFVLFGHSAGGLIGYEVARRIDTPDLRLLAVAASAPPSEVGAADDLTDAELLDALRAWGATPEEVLADPTAAPAVLARLRADLVVVASCHRPWSKAAQLTVPIMAFAGAGDESATLADCAAWSRWTIGRFTLHTVEGGHFFPQKQAARLLDAVARAVPRLR